MSKRFFRTILVLLVFPSVVGAEVLDVNGDGIVGPEEALEVSDQWRLQAKGAADHNHLGQTWTANGNGLQIQGSSPNGLMRLNNSGGDGFLAVSQFGGSYAGAFISTAGRGIFITAATDAWPDILFGTSAGGNDNGVIASDLDDVDSDLVFQSNDHIDMQLDRDGNNASLFRILNQDNLALLVLDETIGNLNIEGTYFNSLKATRIDHPLDPAGKTLTHYSADSPEAVNIYSGNVVLDSDGTATVQLPDYFEAYNEDFRYQLTCVGGFAPVYVAEEVSSNRFKIAGGTPGLKVSWEVTGVRTDPFARKNARVNEAEKSEAEKGLYIHPDLYGKGPDKSLYAGSEP